MVGLFKIEALKLVPFGKNYDSMRTFARLVGIVHDIHGIPVFFRQLSRRNL